jgi:hypothetical protein
MGITEPGRPVASTCTQSPEGPTIAHTSSTSTWPGSPDGLDSRRQTTRVRRRSFETRAPGSWPARVSATAPRPLCLRLLLRGEFGDLLHGLGVQRIQPPRDLAGHMVGAAGRHPDRRCPQVFVSDTFSSACSLLRISLQLARPRTRTRRSWRGRSPRYSPGRLAALSGRPSSQLARALPALADFLSPHGPGQRTEHLVSRHCRCCTARRSPTASVVITLSPAHSHLCPRHHSGPAPLTTSRSPPYWKSSRPSVDSINSPASTGRPDKPWSWRGKSSTTGPPPGCRSTLGQSGPIASTESKLSPSARRSPLRTAVTSRRSPRSRC